jgi:cytoskeleton protein RodZ
MTAIGETLRRERLKRNLELDQISRELKISARMLAAIEAEQFGKLPGGVFARSFVRQYAHYLGLDEDEMATAVQRLLDPAEEEPVPPTHAAPVPEEAKPRAKPARAPSEISMPRMRAWDSVSDNGRIRWAAWLPALAGLILVIFGCSALYNWWQQHPNAFTATRTASAPVHEAQPTPPPPIPTPTPEPQASSLPGAAAQTAQQAQIPTPAPQPTPAPAPLAAPTVPMDPNAPVRVQITVQEEVWVRARADGKYIFSATLQAGQTRAITGNENVELLLGNAGGAEIQLNGKPIPPVGAKGQARTVQFNSGGFKIVPPKPAAPAVLDPL